MEVHGCDIDGEAIAWLNSWPKKIGHFYQVNPSPPLPEGLPQYDLILAQSVFTHLPIDLEDQWLTALSKALRPGGVIVATFHGAAHHRFIPQELRAEFARNGFVFSPGATTPGLPEFYQTSYHSAEDIVRRWAAYGRVVTTVPSGLRGQDVAVIQKI